MQTAFRSVAAPNNFLGIGKEYSTFDSSRVVILPAPFGESTTRGRGPASAPQAIIRASRDIEPFDEETKREFFKEQGIATLLPLNFTGKKAESAIQDFHETVLRLLELNKFVVTLGGTRTLSPPLIAAFAKKQTDLSVLQLDAHSNVHDSHLGMQYGDTRAMARVCEFLDPGRLVQVGVRAQSKQEAEFIRDKKIKIFYAHEIHGGRYTRLLKYWDDVVADQLSEYVYVTMDVDVLDPSIMPATSTPEPDGLQWNEITRCLKKVGQKKKIVGFDLVGLSPIRNYHIPERVAAKLVLKTLNYAF